MLEMYNYYVSRSLSLKHGQLLVPEFFRNFS